MSTRRRLWTALQALAVVLVIVLVDVWISGYFLFRNAADDPLEKVDAIIVLGGEHDGREDYALQLAAEGWAPTVVMSNPYPPPDGVMTRVCRDRDSEAGPIEVLCPVPDPLTTRGEALMMRGLADERGWNKIIVVSWRYHLPRAQFIFRQCFSADANSTVMRAVPQRYHFSPVFWEFLYAYQWGGLAKAIAQGECA